jgi:acetolactate synthase I/II/III large subunit
MRLADYVIGFLADRAIDTAFLVTGGAAMHLNDALAGEARMQTICCHHEQAAAIASEGYARIEGRPCLLQVTAGPGSINAMTGVFGAYVDSIPMIVVSGQAKRELLRSTHGLLPSLRQLGEQEVDTVGIVTPIVKYVCQINDPSRIRYEMEKAFHLATSGRPGPVWLDIPSDVQAASVEPDELAAFRPMTADAADMAPRAETLVEQWQAAERPLLVVGPGVREAGAVDDLERIVRRLGCPVVVAGPQDALATTHPQYAGRMGVFGSRAGNICVQNADLILFVGVRFYLHLVSYNWAALGRTAHKISLEEDPIETERPNAIADEYIVAETAPFLATLAHATEGFDGTTHADWLAWCRQRVEQLPAVVDAMRTVSADDRVNPYWFMEELFRRMEDDDMVVTGNASAALISMQAGQTRRGQRIFSNQGCGAMGYGLPAAIGAAIGAGGDRRVICLVGDGSVMMNLQELQTVAHHQLPIVIVVVNNNGYVSIQQTQRNFFGRLIGSDAAHGVSFPDFVRVAESFGIPARRVSGAQFASQLDDVMSHRGPLLVDAIIDEAQGYEPRITSTRLADGSFVSAEPDNMFPFLSPEELASHRFAPDEGQARSSVVPRASQEPGSVNQ